MKPNELREKLVGVISFPVTPFKSDLSLDLDGYRKNLLSLVDHPLAAIVAPAGTGEIFSLSPDEHKQVVEATLEVVGGRIPVLSGVGVNQPMAVELAGWLHSAGVQGILAFPPYYPFADRQGLLDYYRAIGEATPLGLLIYSRDWAAFSAQAVDELADRIPTLIAWKDGQGDMRNFQRIIQRIGDRLHWIGGAGDDLVRAYYGLGIRTYTSSIANVAPRLSIKLHEWAAAHQDAELSEVMDAIVTPLYEFRARRRGYEVSVMKALMDSIDLTGGPCRPPLPDVTAAEREELKATLPAWKPWL